MKYSKFSIIVCIIFIIGLIKLTFDRVIEYYENNSYITLIILLALFIGTVQAIIYGLKIKKTKKQNDDKTN